MTVIAARRFNRLRAKNAGDDFVSNESVLGGDNDVAAFQESVREQLDDFVRTVAENDVIGGDVELSGNGVAQVKRAAVGIKMCVFDGIADGFDRLWRRAQWIFIRSQLHNLGRRATKLA